MGKSRIVASGTLAVTVECCRCGNGLECDVDVDKAYYGNGFKDVLVDLSDAESELIDSGWEKAANGWLCPDCIEDEQFGEKGGDE